MESAPGTRMRFLLRYNTPIGRPFSRSRPRRTHPHSNWVFAPAALDLIQAGGWCDAPQYTVKGSSLAVSAGNGPNAAVNTAGAVFHVQGDFSVVGSFSAPRSTGTYLSLVGVKNTGSNWWDGLKRLDVGADFCLGSRQMALLNQKQWATIRD